MNKHRSRPLLCKGARIAIISPSYSLSIVANSIQKIATSNLEKLGFKLVIMPNARNENSSLPISISQRLDDIHNAYQNDSIDALISSIGGHGSIDLLDRLDLTMIKQNPKPIIGYSDITSLQNYIYQNTGVLSYLGPHFSTFGMTQGLNETSTRFLTSLTQDQRYKEISSLEWSNDEWYLNQKKRIFRPNYGHKVISPGRTSGIIVGGNLETLQLLAQSGYFIDYRNKITVIEDCATTLADFKTKFCNLTSCSNILESAGFLFGRSPSLSMIDSLDLWLKQYFCNSSIPVISGIDTGHTTPHSCLPIGGKCVIHAHQSCSSIIIH